MIRKMILPNETDAHRTDGLDAMRYGIMQARRGGLTKHDVANTRGWAQVKKMLGRKII